MAALQYVDVPGYAAIIFRHSFTDLERPGALIPRSQEWLEGHTVNGKTARWRELQRTWFFPSGARLSFGYMDSDEDKLRFQSSEFQFCPAAGTEVLMADGSYRAIESLVVGDLVATLAGPRPVTRLAKPRLAECVTVRVTDPNGTAIIGEQTHSVDHRLLTPIGWRSYADMCDSITESPPPRGLSFPATLFASVLPVEETLCAHPYRTDIRFSFGSVVAPCFASPVGEKTVYGITVADASHYITRSGLVQANCGFDELTQFTESQYRYLFSRVRRLKNSPIPIRIRSASNPGNQGHEWVKARFIRRLDPEVDCDFIPAFARDNPYLDVEDYTKSLQGLDYITRRQLLDGDWDVGSKDSLFQRQWFEIVGAAPADAARVRFWDLAASEVARGRDPDYTVGLKLASKNGQYWVEDVQRIRALPLAVERLVRQTAELDGRHVDILREQEPGSGGKESVDHYARTVLAGFNFRGIPRRVNKYEAAKPVSAAAEAGNIKLVAGTWNEAFLDEVSVFRGERKGPHDDIVDALSGAFASVEATFWGPFLT
jgi:predicted phage terminase large subunit-like protein